MKTQKTLLLALFCAFLITGCGNADKPAGENTPPNIIFIMADDLGYGDLGSYGQQKISTPHLDKMAREGMRFTRFYAGSTVCAPSRSTLLTGRHTGHTPIRGNKSVEPEGQWPLPDSAVSIAEVLREAGYTTGDFGKWGLGPVGSTGDPVNQGFDTFFGYNCQSEAHNFYPDHLWRDTQRIAYPNTPEKPVTYAAQEIHDEALAFINEHQEEPFFLFLSYTLPHAALQTAPNDSIFESYKKKFNEQPQPIPETWDGKGYAPQAYPKAAYAAMVSRLDRYVGQVLGQLRQLGLDENTLVIFTSDNGPHKEGGNDPSWFDSNGKFRGIKRDLYEGGIRVPMIAWWPGSVEAGTVTDHAGANWDFFPTFASLAGLADKYTETDGISILPTLLGNEAEQKQHPYLYWEFHEQGGKQAVSIDQWKGVRLGVNKAPDGPIELYNLETDPEETTNIAEAQPEIVSKITGIMEEARVPSADFPFGADERPEPAGAN